MHFYKLSFILLAVISLNKYVITLQRINILQVGLQQIIDKIDYHRLWKSSTTILIID